MRKATITLLLLVLAIVVLVLSLVATAWLANNGYAYAVLFGALWCLGWLIVVIRFRCRLGPERDPLEGNRLKSWFRREYTRSLRFAVGSCIVLVCFFVGYWIYLLRHESCHIARQFLREQVEVQKYIGTGESLKIRLRGAETGFIVYEPMQYRFWLVGEVGRGRAYVTVERAGDRWGVTRATLELRSGYDILLLDKPSSESASVKDTGVYCQHRNVELGR